MNGLGADPDVEVVPGIVWMFCAGPTIEGAADSRMKNELLDDLLAELHIDGIAGIEVVLHGSAAAEGIHCVDEDLLLAIRQSVGHQMPIVSTTDMTGGSSRRRAAGPGCEVGRNLAWQVSRSGAIIGS